MVADERPRTEVNETRTETRRLAAPARPGTRLNVVKPYCCLPLLMWRGGSWRRRSDKASLGWQLDYSTVRVRGPCAGPTLGRTCGR